MVCIVLHTVNSVPSKDQGPVSISKKTYFRKISSSLEAARLVFRIVRSLWNLTGTSAALLPMCLSNFKAIRRFKVQISWLRDFTRSYEKTSFRILRRGPGHFIKSSAAMAFNGQLLHEVSFLHLPVNKTMFHYINIYSCRHALWCECL